jgi:hypothetical protein
MRQRGGHHQSAHGRKNHKFSADQLSSWYFIERPYPEKQVLRRLFAESFA